MNTYNMIGLFRILWLSTITIFISCNGKRGFNEAGVSKYLLRIAGIAVNDSIQIIEHTQTGFDMHGDGGETYSIQITNTNHSQILMKIELDSLVQWKMTDDNFIFNKFPSSLNDTLISIAVSKSKPMIYFTLSE